MDLRDAILNTRGCVGLWMGEEVSGTRATDLTNTNQGTWTGTPSRGAPTATPGSQTPSANYLGTNGNYILCKSGNILSNLTNSSLLVSAMVPGGTSSGGGKALYCERGSSGNDIWKLEWSGPSQPPRVRFTHRNDGGTLTQTLGTSTAGLNDGGPHVIGITKAGTALRHFRDGLFDGATTLGGNDTFTNATLEARIGSDKGDNTVTFTHFIGFAAAFNRTLGDGEMAFLSLMALGR